MFLKAVILFCCILAIPLVLVATALFQNELPWRPPPGPVARLVHYLNSNDIRTEIDSIYPELRSRQYQKTDTELFDDIKRVVNELGWEIIDANHKSLSLHALVTSSLWQYKDDVYVNITKNNKTGYAVNIRSKSRTGKGDLGTNTRHIMDVYTALDRMAGL